jgi:hypothetical protein
MCFNSTEKPSQKKYMLFLVDRKIYCFFERSNLILVRFCEGYFSLGMFVLEGVVGVCHVTKAPHPRNRQSIRKSEKKKKNIPVEKS